MTTYNRHRDRTERSDPITTSMWYSISYDRDYMRQVMDDVLVPDFAMRKQRGDIMINPLWFEETAHLLPDDTVTWHTEGYPGNATADASGTANYLRGCAGYVPQTADYISGTGNFSGIPATVDTDSAEELVKQASLAFVDKPQYGFGEDIAEIRETLSLLRHPLKSLVGVVRAFSKKARRLDSIKDSAQKAKALAELWATYSFAVRPLLQSIDEAYKALHDQSVVALRRTSRSKENLEAETTSQEDGYHESGNYASATITNTTTVDLHAGVIYDAPQVQDLRLLLGLRNKDLIVTAYEVIPLSFMVDRIVNLKRSLMTLINVLDPTVKVKGAFLVKRERFVHTVMCDSIIPPEGTSIVAFNPLPHLSYTFRMTRVEWSPGISFSMPLLNPKELVRDISSIADLVALLVLWTSPLLLRR